jgi:hypothetical protein
MAVAMGFAADARADDDVDSSGRAASRQAPEPYGYEPRPVPPPLARRGFQMALRSGLALPFGSFRDRGDAGMTGGAPDARDLVGPQIPLAFDIGAKASKWIFVGGYLSLAAGLAAGQLSASCDSLRLDCRALSFRIGAQIHYAIAPDDRLNPWVGYGLGYSSVTVGDDGADVTYRGFDFGHFMAGLDVRVSRIVGIGPFVDFTVGKYASRTIETSAGTIDGDIAGRSFHYWLTVGPRLTILP